MKNLIKNTGKNCLSILLVVLVTMMFFVTNSNAYEGTETVVNVKAAIEGLYNESNGYLAKDAEVTMYLRYAESPYKIVDIAKGLIDKTTMMGSFTFTNVPTGQYYIVLKSKNSIETWSRKGGELITNVTKTMYDFTIGKDKAFGDNMNFSGKHSTIYTADVDQDGFVNENDVALVLNGMINQVKRNPAEDLDGDGLVTNSDYAIVLGNAKKQIKAITPMNSLTALDRFETPKVIVQITAIIEGLLNPNEGTLVNDAAVTVYLRNEEPPYEIAGVAEGLINKTTFTGTFGFTKVSPGIYYIVLKSKNSVETWSMKCVEIMYGTIATYDFTTGKDKAYGENMYYNGKFSSIYTGDVDQDGFVSKYDVVAVENDMYNVKNDGDVPTDLNGDGYVNKLDYIIVYTNWGNNVQSITPMNSLTALDRFKTPKVFVQITAIIEGLLNPNEGTLVNDAAVTVYLRNEEPPYEIAGVAEGLINKTTFTGTFGFTKVSPGIYYIVLKSKNSVETWSMKCVEIMYGTIATYDFTTGKDKAYGENMYYNGKFSSIYTGDVDQDGFVSKYDVVAVENDMYNVKNDGDVPTDLNGDGYVNKLDYIIVYTNWGNNVQSITPMNSLKPLTQKDASTESFTIKQNNPNPFNPSTKITFNVQKTSNVKLSIYDISGKEVAQLVNTVLNAGSYTHQWNASNFASGTYFYKINVNGLEQTMKMHLIK